MSEVVTIDKSVQDVFSVPFHQVIYIPKDATVLRSAARCWQTTDMTYHMMT